jgi:hypothetical protein
MIRSWCLDRSHLLNYYRSIFTLDRLSVTLTYSIVMFSSIEWIVIVRSLDYLLSIVIRQIRPFRYFLIAIAGFPVVRYLIQLPQQLFPEVDFYVAFVKV